MKELPIIEKIIIWLCVIESHISCKYQYKVWKTTVGVFFFTCLKLFILWQGCNLLLCKTSTDYIINLRGVWKNNFLDRDVLDKYLYTIIPRTFIVIIYN